MLFELPDLITLLQYALAGAAVGFVVGLTGVGGGSFMTPILVSVFGVKMAVAVGTDLLYAAITKANGVWVHKRQKTVEWPVVSLLAAGSLPASVATVVFLSLLQQRGIDYAQYLTITLGVMLTLTAIVLLIRPWLVSERQIVAEELGTEKPSRKVAALTVVTGVALGILVTLSSVGAGAFGAAVLMVMYPRMPMIRVIGTDLAHAVPLTLIAGTGHMLHLGHVDFGLLLGLLIGSLPAIWLGTKLASRLPDAWIRPVMALILLGLGIKYTVF
ncbi:permease [gamma proteobacterium HTCC5015]|nr:permease [gamma proteobacterium HTCC5015]